MWIAVSSASGVRSWLPEVADAATAGRGRLNPGDPTVYSVNGVAVLLAGRQGARCQSASMGTAPIFSPNGRVC